MDSLQENRSLTEPVRVLTIDDHPIFRRGIHNLLEAEEDMIPVAEVGSVADAMEWLAAHHADVLLLDHNLPGAKGIPSLPDLLNTRPDIQAIILTVSDNDADFLDAIRFGACGYLLKDAAPDRLLAAIRAAARGQCRISGKMVRTLFQRVNQPVEQRSTARLQQAAELDSPNSLEKPLTARDKELLHCLCRGLSNKEIAKELGLSPNTVRNQLQRLQDKFSARNRVQLALLARDVGCV